MRELCDNDDNNSKLSVYFEISGFDLINDVVLDYMHIMCLNVMKKLVKTLLNGDLKNRIGYQISSSISQRLEKLKKHVPVEFVRKFTILGWLESHRIPANITLFRTYGFPWFTET